MSLSLLNDCRRKVLLVFHSISTAILSILHCDLIHFYSPGVSFMWFDLNAEYRIAGSGELLGGRANGPQDGIRHPPESVCRVGRLWAAITSRKYFILSSLFRKTENVGTIKCFWYRTIPIPIV